jgi:hypothetical protein
MTGRVEETRKGLERMAVEEAAKRTDVTARPRFLTH